MIYLVITLTVSGIVNYTYDLETTQNINT